jgi:hypothetical protein
VLIVLGLSVASLISAATLRRWSVPLALVLAAAVITLAALWWAWMRAADRDGLQSPARIVRFAAANLPIVAGIAAASAGLHLAILAADGGHTIAIAPRAALYGGVSICLAASTLMPASKPIARVRAARLVTSAGALGLVFIGAIVPPVYLVPALALLLVTGLAAEAQLDRRPSLTRKYARRVELCLHTDHQLEAPAARVLRRRRGPDRGRDRRREFLRGLRRGGPPAQLAWSRHPRSHSRILSRPLPVCRSTPPHRPHDTGCDQLLRSRGHDLQLP